MFKNKLLVLCAAFVLTSTLNAKTTVCYKKSWDDPAAIEKTPLDGGECKGEKSLKQMQADGWFIKDIEINSSEKGLDYNYILSDINPVAISKELLSKNNLTDKVDTKLKGSTLLNLTEDTATITIGNLKIGQSGIIQHRYENGHSIIVSNAYVVDSSTNSSTIKFIPFLDLKQNAIPTTKRKVSASDIFILNYMYDQSLLITPNIDTFRSVRGDFPEHNFIHPDIFAAYLKSEYQPLPSKKLIQEYAMSQNLGTIFFVLENSLYIVDTRTFTILSKQNISNLTRKSQMPFYTRVENIESNVLTTDFWSMFDFSYISKFFVDDRTEDEILYGDLAKGKNTDAKADYTTYYSNILGIEK